MAAYFRSKFRQLTGTMYHHPSFICIFAKVPVAKKFIVDAGYLAKEKLAKKRTVLYSEV